MLKQRLMRWGVLVASVAFLGLAGCDDLEAIVNQLMGAVGGA